MSDHAIEHDHDHGHGGHDDAAHEHAHPGWQVYSLVAVVLIILTAMEIGVFYAPGVAGSDADSPRDPEVYPGRGILHALEIRRAGLYDPVRISIAIGVYDLWISDAALPLPGASHGILNQRGARIGLPFRATKCGPLNPKSYSPSRWSRWCT
jgi:hypothetical protein